MITFSSVKVTIIQTAVLCLLTLTAWLGAGGVMAYSVLLGGLISVVPNAYFVRRVFLHSGARAMEKVVRSALLGELVKLVLMGTGFALTFTLVEPLAVAGVFGGFILTHVAGMAVVIRYGLSGKI